MVDYFGTATDLKTKQVYESQGSGGTSDRTLDYEANSSVYGDALYETSTSFSGYTSWNGDSSYFPYSDYPFFRRGSATGNTTGAGIFFFSNNTGYCNNEYGFRPVLCIEEKETYEVTFNANGGTIDNLGSTETTRIVTVGSTYAETEAGFPEAVREGYDFLGWFTELEGGEQITAETTVMVNAQILYAHWEAEKPKAIYNANGGTFDVGTTNTVKYTVSEEEVVGKETYKTSNVSADGTSANTSTGYGNNLTTTEVIYVPGAPEITVKVTYQTENVKYDWVAIYDGSVKPDATNFEQSKSGKLGGGTTTTTQIITVPGDTVQIFFRSDGSICNYYGYYAEVSYNFMKKTPTVIEGEYKNPTREGYDFIGWTTDSNSSKIEYAPGAENIPTETKTLYAVWAIKVTYNANGGVIKGTEDTETTRILNIGDKYEDSVEGIPMVERRGYTFKGWYTAAEGGEEVTAETIVTTAASNQTLYAHWEEGEAVAVLLISENEGTEEGHLIFARLNDIPEAGDIFEDKEVVFVFTGIETEEYYADMLSSDSYIPEWTQVGPYITSVEFRDKIAPISTAGWFGNFTQITSLDLSNLDTSKVTDMSAMFMLSGITELDLSSFDTSNVTNMSVMFYQCEALAKLNLNNWNTENVTNMMVMFTMSGVTELDLSGFDTRNVTNMMGMFAACEYLTKLNISNFNTNNVADMMGIFDECISLQEVSLGSNFAFVGTDCYLPTPDGTVIDGADGNWYNKSTGVAYTPEQIPNNTAATYVAVEPEAEIITYQVIFNANGGTIDGLGSTETTRTVTEGSTYGEAEAGFPSATREGYSFLGWFTESEGGEQVTSSAVVTSVANGQTLYAQFIKLNYQINYNLDGGSIAGTNQTNYNVATEEITLINPTKDGYEFEGWTEEIRTENWSDGYINETTGEVEESATYPNSVYSEKLFLEEGTTYTLESEKEGTLRVYNLDGTYKEEVQLVAYLASLDENFLLAAVNGTSYTAEKDCYVRIVLENGATKEERENAALKSNTKEIITIKSGSTGNRTYIANYSQKEYSIIFNTDGGSEIAKLKVKYGEVITSSATPTKTGYNFVRWEPSLPNTMPASDITVKAIWSAQKYTVTFDNVDGTSTQKSLEYGTTYGTLPVPTNDTGSFVGWYKEKSYTTAVTDATVLDVTSDVTVYAKWEMENVAIYTAGNQALTFYKPEKMLKVGDTYNNQVITAIYADIETVRYSSSSGYAAWNNYASNIKTVSFANEIKPLYTSYWFRNFTNCESIDLTNLNTVDTKRMTEMFRGCSKLTTLDTSKLITTNVMTNMASMFEGCSSLTVLDISGFVTANVDNMNFMFRNCSNLTTIIGLNKFNTEKVTTMTEMFFGCQKLAEIDLSSFKTPALTNIQSMFSGCNSVTKLDLSGFDTRKVTSMQWLFNENCNKLQEITLGENFVWIDGENIYLPTPKSSYIPEADGKWYNTETYATYTPENIPNSTAATYSAIPRYIVTFDANGGNIGDLGSSQTTRRVIVGTTYGSVAAGFPEAVKDGYTFAGWYTAKDGGSLIEASTRVTNLTDTTLYAHWKCNVIAKQSTWFKGNTVKRTEITSISFKSSYSPIGTVTEQWAADADNSGSIMCYVEGTDLIIAGTGEDKIYANEKCNYMFSGVSSYEENDRYFSALTRINGLEILDTSRTTDMYYMFSECNSLTTLDVSKFDTSKVTSMAFMFKNCIALESLSVSSRFVCNNVTSFQQMFLQCTSLKELDLSSFTVNKATNMQGMFQFCESLKTLKLPGFYTGAAKRMEQMFQECYLLTELNLESFDTTNVTSTYWMFAKCKALEKVTLSNKFVSINNSNMEGMFAYCEKLNKINLSSFGANKTTSLKNMFNNCLALTELDISNLDTTLVTNANQMFYKCSSIVTLDISSFSTEALTTADQMFGACNNLTTIYASKDFVTTNISSAYNMFQNCTKIVGGAGTTWKGYPCEQSYACIDGQDSNNDGVADIGYFTEK